MPLPVWKLARSKYVGLLMPTYVYTVHCILYCIELQTVIFSPLQISLQYTDIADMTYMKKYFSHWSLQKIKPAT